MEIEKGKIITPDKKQDIIQEILSEIAAINNTIRQGNVGEETLKNIRENREKLQALVNSLFKKKGVITPSETDNIINSIDESKKQRLEKSYIRGVRMATIYLVAFILIGGVLVYINKRKK